MPETRSRLPELDSNFGRTDHAATTGEHDPAFLFFPTELVFQNHAFIDRYLGLQIDQCAMGVDH